MHRAPTQHRVGRGVNFAPLAQNDLEPIAEPSDEVSQRWQNSTANEAFRSRIHDIFRNTAPIAEDDYDDEENGLRHFRSGATKAAYAPVGNLIRNRELEEAGIAELAGPPTEFYAPSYARAPSALSKASDTRTEITWAGSEPGDKFPRYAPRVVSVEVEGDGPSDPPGTRLNDKKPFALRRSFLSVLLLIVVVLLVLVEVAIRVLPDNTNSLTTGLVSRNSSQIESRSSGDVVHGVRFPRELGIRKNDTSEASSTMLSASSANEVSISTSTTSSTSSTSSITTAKTTPEHPSPTEVESEASSTTTTLTTTTTSPTTTSTTSTQATSSTTTTTTTTADTQSQVPSKGGNPPPSTLTGKTTIVAPTTDTKTSLTTAETSPDKGQPTGKGTSSTNSDPQPTGGSHDSGGDKTRSTDRNPSPTDTDRDASSTTSSISSGGGSSITESSSRSSPGNSSPTNTQPDPTNSNPKPTGGSSQTGQPDAPTTTSSTLQMSSSQGQETAPSSSTTSNEDSGAPHLTTDLPLVTCTVETINTNVQWVTIPALTIDLGLGLKKKHVAPTPKKLRRQGPACDTTVTVTRDITAISTTALTTITIGIGSAQPDPSTISQTNNPGGPLQTTTYAVDTSVSSISYTYSGQPDPSPTDAATLPTDTPTPSADLPGQDTSSTTNSQISDTSQQPVGPTETVPAVTATTSTILPDTNTPGGSLTNPPPSSTATLGTTVVTDIDGSTVLSVPPPQSVTNQSPTTVQSTQSATAPSPTTVQSTQSATAQSPTTVQSTRLAPSSTTQLPQTGPFGQGEGNNSTYTTPDGLPETKDPPPTPITTVFNVIESTTIVSSVVFTVTPTASETDKNGGVALGAVFLTTVPTTSKMFVTRLRTQQVLTGAMTDSNDGIQVVRVTELTDNSGVPTSTMTQTLYGFLTTETLTNSDGFPTGTATNKILKDSSETTITDSDGKVSVKTFYMQTSTTTLRNSNGLATATQTLDITETPTVITETDAAGNPTKTITKMIPDGTSTRVVMVTSTNVASPNASVSQATEIVPISSGPYFTGLLLPTLLAIGLSIPIRILDQTAKLYQPFSAMTGKYGARTADSLCLRTTGMWGLISGFISPRTGNWLLAVTGLLVLSSSIVIALSPEAIQLAVQKSECAVYENGNLLSCKTTLSISNGPAQAIFGLFCCMAILIGVAAWALWRRRTGILTDHPWSMFHIAEMARHDDILMLLKNLDSRHNTVSRDKAIMAFGNRRFVLKEWRDKSGWQYGVMIENDAGGLGGKNKKNYRERRKGMPFFTLSLAGRALFFLLLLGLLLMILLYHNTGGEFQTFMDSENFGGRFILTGAGIIVSLIWWTFFICIAFLSPYRLLYRKKIIYDAVHLSPPTNPFSGFWRVISRQHPDTYLGVVAFTAILSDLLPLFLANIPTRSNESNGMSAVCIWLAVGVLCAMIIVLIWSFLITWPDMPIDPSLIAGAMFYAMHLSEFIHGTQTRVSVVGGRPVSV